MIIRMKISGLRGVIVAWLTAVWIPSGSLAAVPARALPEPKPVPELQLVPHPYQQIAFERAGREVARYHFGADLRRPFVFPLIGPSGRILTRMGHPHDPEGHSHHNSFWIAHHDVNGVSFWGDRGTNHGRIVHQRIERLLDGDGAEAAVISHNLWITDKGQTLLQERRQAVLKLLPAGEYFLIVDLELTTKSQPVTFGKTPFGLVGVRMAKSIGVHDGGGRIRNSEGGLNEAGVHWRPARWVDYSGRIRDAVIEGITLMDHPANPNHPTFFHVRDDGWMGTGLTFDAARTVEPDRPLKLRYGLHIHAQMPTLRQIEAKWEEFVRTRLPEAPAGRNR
jgi:hypothetical protein